MSEPVPVDGPSEWAEPAPVIGSSEAAATHDAILLQLGSIGVGRHWVVTASGNSPLAETQFTMTDRTTVQSYYSTGRKIGVVVLSLFCLLGLLLLLQKDTRTVGHIEVDVTGPKLHHLEQIPVGVMTVAQVAQVVAKMQNMALNAA